MMGITHRRVHANGIQLHLAEAGDGFPVVFLHGFPELWYTWRHQLAPVAAAGYRAVALDVRGYGESDAPREVERYRMLELTADVSGVLDALGAERGVLVGHDWGARIAWHFAQLHPERTAAVVALSVPFFPRAPTVEELKRLSGDAFNFALYFQEPGVAEAELEADVRRTLRLFMYALSGDAPPDLLDALFRRKPATAGALDGVPEPPALPPWLGEADLDAYAAAFARTGFRGALNRYRNMDRDARDLGHLAAVKVAAPALFIGGDRDSAVRYGSLEPMKAAVPNLREVALLSGCGHWVEERPAEVNARLLAFLRSEVAAAPTP
jgi:pimeloyl-ACP methyl ester carboxylesterase